MKILRILKDLIHGKKHEFIPTIHKSLAHYKKEYLEKLKDTIINADKPIYFEAPLPRYSLQFFTLDAWLHDIAIEHNKEIHYFESAESQIDLYNKKLVNLNKAATLESTEAIERLDLKTIKLLGSDLSRETVATYYDREFKDLQKKYEHARIINELCRRDEKWQEPYCSSLIIVGIAHYYNFKKD